MAQASRLWGGGRLARSVPCTEAAMKPVGIIHQTRPPQ